MLIAIELLAARRRRVRGGQYSWSKNGTVLLLLLLRLLVTDEKACPVRRQASRATAAATAGQVCGFVRRSLANIPRPSGGHRRLTSYLETLTAVPQVTVRLHEEIC